MKRILGLAALMGHMFTSAVAKGAGFHSAPGGRSASKRPWKMLQAYRERYGYKPNPEQPRFWHNISDPVQVQRFRDAQLRRDRRADKLQINTERSFKGNNAHHSAFHRIDDVSGYILPLNLNPFYIAK